jgi:ribonuclease VapC
MTRLIEGLGFEIVLVSAAAARRIEPSYAQCGKRDYPAGLSFCNCFALLCL